MQEHCLTVASFTTLLPRHVWFLFNMGIVKQLRHHYLETFQTQCSRSRIRSNLIVKGRESKPVLVLSIRVADCCVGLLILSLTQLDN